MKQFVPSRLLMSALVLTLATTLVSCKDKDDAVKPQESQSMIKSNQPIKLADPTPTYGKYDKGGGSNTDGGKDH